MEDSYESAATQSPWLTNPSAATPSVGPESPYRLDVIDKKSFEEQLTFYEALLNKRCDNSLTTDEREGLCSLMAEITADESISDNPLSAIAKVFPALEGNVDAVNDALADATRLMDSVQEEKDFKFTQANITERIASADPGTYDEDFNFEKFTLAQNYLRAALLSYLIFGDAEGKYEFEFQEEITGDEDGNHPDFMKNLMSRFDYQKPGKSWGDLYAKPSP